MSMRNKRGGGGRKKINSDKRTWMKRRQVRAKTVDRSANILTDLAAIEGKKSILVARVNANKSPTFKGLDSRAAALQLLISAQNGASLSMNLPCALAAAAPENKAFLHELALGTLRHWFALARLAESLAVRETPSGAMLAAFNLGAYQLLYLQTPDYAAINATIEAARVLKMEYAIGALNAMLRKIAKNCDKYRKKVAQHHSLPNFLAKQLKRDWVEQYTQLGQNLRTAAPIFLRVNRRFASVEAYSAQLTAQEIAHQIVAIGIDGYDDARAIQLLQNVNVVDLPYFADGWVSVQDRHAQLAAQLLARACANDVQLLAKNGLRILDACAAPAGKTAHLLELDGTSLLCEIVSRKTAGFKKDNIVAINNNEYADLQVGQSADNGAGDNVKLFHVKQLVAMDNSEKRLQIARATLERLQFGGLMANSVDGEMNEQKLHLICADATTFALTDKQNSAQKFDAILLDAPCSATGVMRRHPDISLLKDEQDIGALVQLQGQILRQCWTNLAAGGYLLYATCSLLKQENEQQVSDFLAEYKDAKALAFVGNLALNLPNQLLCSVGVQCLPLESDDGDGFYYALLKKVVDI